MDPSQKVAIVTGAGTGIGRASALALLRDGYCVALAGRRVEALDGTTAQAGDAAERAIAVPTDVGDPGSVQTLFARTIETFGRLDVLFNNAGTGSPPVLMEDLTYDQWKSVVDANLTGTFLCGREAAALMATKAKGQGDNGVIINIASISKAGNMGQSNYSATKAGVASLVVCWARELGRYGIRVGGIARGVIETSMTGSMKPEALDRLVQAVPVKRLGAVDEVARSARFIIENAYFSGRVLELDGGLRI